MHTVEKKLEGIEKMMRRSQLLRIFAQNPSIFGYILGISQPFPSHFLGMLASPSDHLVDL